jgi:3-phosphoshikimate 1-carboxyvinyltransferase
MIAKVSPVKLSGQIQAIASKSSAHRLLICAALSDKDVTVNCNGTSEDIQATCRCLEALGAKILFEEDKIRVKPIPRIITDRPAVLDCGESGSTLRFMLPVVAGLGRKAIFKASGRLPQRPLSPLYEILGQKGCTLSEKGVFPFTVEGKACGGDYEISGNVSSQYITGLLLMLPLVGGGTVNVTGEFESRSYVDMTVSAMRKSGIEVRENNNLYTVPNSPYTLKDCHAEGDWSNAAFWLSSGALGNGIKMTGLDLDSLQGDKEITTLLERFGAKVEIGEEISISPAPMKGIKIDAKNIPDLVPVLSVVACAAEGETVIYNASRLRLKESDRIATTIDLITSLGGKARETDDGLVISGTGGLYGGKVNSHNDHRIVMAAAVASNICKTPVIIEGAEAKNKSYPTFFTHMKTLGGNITEG